MQQQTIYHVVDAYDFEEPISLAYYNNRNAAEQHAAYLNQTFAPDETEPVFAVVEEVVLSEFALQP